MADPSLDASHPQPSRDLPDTPDVFVDSPVERHNRRLGLVCFAIYFVMYASFVGITVYDYRILGKPALAGLNLAIVFGFGLIVAAFVLAVVYMAMCRKEPSPPYPGERAG